MLVLLLSAVLVPADTVTGRVVDNGGQAVPQAIVEITELGRSVTATDAGAFRIELAPGRYTLAVRRHGFAPAVREISVGAGQAAPVLEIVLVPSAFRLEPVTVTATRQALASENSPLPASALAGDELRQTEGVSLAQVVEALPGARTISTGAQIGKPVIRGFSGPRVLVLENGSRLEDYSWSDEDGPSVETAFVRRVELIRGPASVLYGSDALGGVINVIPDQLPDAAGEPGFVRTGFTLSGASNNIEVEAGAHRRSARQHGLACQCDRARVRQPPHAGGRAQQHRIRRIQRRSSRRLALAVGQQPRRSRCALRRRVQAAGGECASGRAGRA